MISLAHQGGWDEFLFFVGPVVLGLWALRVAEKRARRRAQAEASSVAQGESARDVPHYDAPT